MTRKLPPQHLLLYLCLLRIQSTPPLSSPDSRNSFTFSLVISKLSMVIIEEASSSSSTHPWKYHVFLSFRGEDTRYNFTDHLYNALCREGIITFMDDQLRRGEEISTELLQAIEQSRISIIVFSENYASSKWCLEELVKILDCKKSNRQEVRPVFYKVNPSDIRNHRGSFGEALASHECLDKVQEWKAALKEAASLSGWTLSEHQSEFRFIHDIVGEISKQLIKRTHLCVATYPVGIEPRVQKIHELLGVEGRDVHMVGIWGTGGIGKTTIAKDVYNSIAHEFEGSCFLENVRENSMLDRGFIKLQKKLLFEILGGTKLKVANVAGGITVIKERLQYKRVLLVLDDVNDMDQLNNLAGEPSWFGKGSKIIITTRDKKLLTDHCVDLIYKVKELNHDEALDLFSMNAFKRNRPLDGYAKLTEHALCYAQGLPLVLIVLGSSLHGKNVEKWQAALDGFKSRKIQDVLKRSYEGLDYDVKESFLDIACFFKGEDREHVIQILEACGCESAEFVIDVLIEKALISIISSWMHVDCIWMHDLLEEMGRDIVHQESPNVPGDRSRLWFHKDVYRVLTENIGTKNVIGIKVELPKDSDEICLSGTTFANMQNLRLFIHRAGRYSGVVDNLPNSLRVVDWPNYPLQLLPSNSIPREIALINMPRSCITRLEVGYKRLINLTSINLKDCQYLTKVLDLSGSPNLQSLDLSGCGNLVEVDRSVGFLNKLDYLSLWACYRLETFPTEVSWKSMRRLVLNDCRRLESFINKHKMESIKILWLSGSSIKELHSCIGRCTTLKVLHLRCVASIKQFPSSIGNLTSLVELDASETLIEELPSSIGNLTSLRQLMLSKTPIKELPSSIGNLTSLEALDVCETLIEELPSSIWHLTSLETLKLSKTLIKELPSSIGYLNSLLYLEASGTLIRELPSSIGNLTSLRQLTLSKTPIKELPSSIGYLNSLTSLNASETLIEELPSSIGNLTSLSTLEVSKTPIKELPSSIGNLTSLNTLEVSKTPIKELPSSIGNLISLSRFDASETMIEELPSSIENLFRIPSWMPVIFLLNGCANLRTVPQSVYGGLKELYVLNLSWCPKLVTFPSRASALVSSSAESLPPMLPTNSNNGHDHHPGSLLFPQLLSLSLCGCKLSVSDFLTNLDCASTLRHLTLSGSSFDSLPACISNYRELESLALDGCKRLRDLSELPPNIKHLNLDDCVSLERFSKLSNILEQRDTLGLLDTMHLSNCNRLVDNLGMDVVSKMAKALLNQLVCHGFGWYVKCWELRLSSLPGIEVPKWFNRGEEATSVPRGNICEILIKIPRNLKGERIRLVVCVVLKITQDFSGECDVTVVINKQRSGGGRGGYKLSSAHGDVYVCLTCIDFMGLEVVDHEVRVNFRNSRGKGLLHLKSFGVHLANMQENDDDQVSGEYSARESYRQSNASISDFENEEGAAVASLASDDSSSGEVDNDHHDGEQEQEQEPHPPTERFEDLTRQTNIGRAMLAFLRCFGITTCL